MAKTSTTIGSAFRSGDRFRAFSHLATAARLVFVIVSEWKTAAAAENDYRDLARMSEPQLKEMGLTRRDLARYISGKYYG